MKQVNLKFIAFVSNKVGNEFSLDVPLRVTLNISVHVEDDVSIVPVLPRDRSFLIPCNGYYLNDETAEDRNKIDLKSEDIFALYQNGGLLRIDLSEMAKKRLLKCGEFWEICYARQVEC